MKKVSIALISLALIATAFSPLAAQPAEDVNSAPVNLTPNGAPGPLFNGAGNVLYDNGPLLTNPGAGCTGNDLSQLENLALGMTTLGAAAQGDLTGTGNYMADDFSIPDAAGWQIDSCTFYSYQTGAPATSTITGAVVQIWDGPPNAGGSVIFGDLTTNAMTNTGFSGINRAAEDTPTDCNRNVFAIEVAVGTTLPAGDYWIQFAGVGNAAFSGPWMPPVTIPGQSTTGNALQFFGGAWQDFTDGGSFTNLGIPFTCSGNVVPQDADLSIVKSGEVVGSDVVWTIDVTNNGPDDAIDVVVTDMLPAEVSYVSDDCGGVNTPPWEWGIGSLANCATVSCNITTAIVDASATSISNDASVASGNNDPVTANNAGSGSVSVGTVLDIPTLGFFGMLSLLLLLGGAGVMILKRS